MNISLSKMYMDDEIKGAVNDILTSGYYIKGQNLRSFESEFAQAFNVEYAIGVSSGTSAILLAMMALGVKKGDEVIVPSHTFIATASPAKFLGADIVYADIDPDTYTISPDDIAEKITDKT
ncbi:MAG: aminotransferase class I/II-fold pyridoxal phosphate-dependent enzyme, partial [Methanosarcinales archaeon]|nr:aminotransferase class I/II-fold pyridoxal phosphate-dependent enzyme [Methanosarcinales archaeon]